RSSRPLLGTSPPKSGYWLGRRTRDHEAVNPTRIELSLQATAEAPRLVRRALDERPALQEPELRFLLRLLVTELVTNAVRHAGLDPDDRVEVVIAAEHDVVSVRGTDHGSGGPRLPARASVARVWGRGLALVPAL